MKKIAIVIQSPPHGTSAGREALDCALALSDEHDLSLFLVGAGVLHLLTQQDPDQILSRNYIKAFALLDLYEIEQVYYAIEDLNHYGFPTLSELSFAAQGLTQAEISPKWREHAMILTF